MIIPKSVRNLIEAFERLPGIGPKTAARLTFYLLHVPESEVEQLAEAVSRLKKDTVICSICFNVAEKDPCAICSSPQRDREVLAVVESPLDVLALERAGFKGLYHVLHGVIDPLNNIGPEELKIKELLDRVARGVSVRSVTNASVPSRSARGIPPLADARGSSSFACDTSPVQPSRSLASTNVSSGADLRNVPFKEIILATNPSVEGEATAMYIANKIRELKSQISNLKSIKITRLARGLPVGGDLEYADDVTLGKALEGRTEY